MDNNIPTSWMWRDEQTDKIQGALADPDTGIIQWFDEPGCACTGSDAAQTFDAFLKNGTHAVDVPPEIEKEIRNSLRLL